MIAPLRLGCLISGGGRTVMNLLDHIESGQLRATIALVIASRPDAPGVARAKARGLPVRMAWRRDYPDEAAMHDAITAWLVEARVDLVCLCGYLRWLRIDPPFVGKVVNIHPALLPRFGGHGMHGRRVHEAVLDARQPQSGCTVHFVDDQYDRGPIILQRSCPVLPDDDAATLAARVFAEECVAYPEAINLIASGRVKLEGGAVRIDPPTTSR